MTRIAIVAGAMCALAFAAAAQAQAPPKPPPAVAPRSAEVIDYRPIKTSDGKQAYLYHVATLDGRGAVIEVIDARIRVYRPGSIVTVTLVDGEARFSTPPRSPDLPYNSYTMDRLEVHAPMTAGSH